MLVIFFFRVGRLHTCCIQNSLFCRYFPEAGVGGTPLFGVDRYVPEQGMLFRVLDPNLLTLPVPIVTNSNFLLTISTYCQEIRLRELIK